MRQLGCRTRAPSKCDVRTRENAGTNLARRLPATTIVAPRTRGIGTPLRTSIRNDTERTVSAAGGSATEVAVRFTVRPVTLPRGPLASGRDAGQPLLSARARAGHDPKPRGLDVAPDVARARPPPDRRPDRLPPRPGCRRRGADRRRGDRRPPHRPPDGAHRRRLPARDRAGLAADERRRPGARDAARMPALPRRPGDDRLGHAAAGRRAELDPIGPLQDRAAGAHAGRDRRDARGLQAGCGVRGGGRPGRRRGVRRDSATCRRSSSRATRTSAPTSTAGASRTGSASCARCSRRCGRGSARTARSAAA